ncbi:hypothetical protein NDU88_004696 [Pleurodeles waltl]|uniref:Uncharacterized protein n=1 Tax=Pleurodeles waltl TaxID=8319 RepID=A0AAV7VJX5_PLEWA|nr:hypothetical protein NDU88_004696 [Pleurodeles waltl]
MNIIVKIKESEPLCPGNADRFAPHSGALWEGSRDRVQRGRPRPGPLRRERGGHETTRSINDKTAKKKHFRDDMFMNVACSGIVPTTARNMPNYELSKMEYTALNRNIVLGMQGESLSRDVRSTPSNNECSRITESGRLRSPCSPTNDRYNCRLSDCSFVLDQNTPVVTLCRWLACFRPLCIWDVVTPHTRRPRQGNSLSYEMFLGRRRDGMWVEPHLPK